MENKKKPEQATTAVAESLEETLNSSQPAEMVDDHYIGNDGDRLFTRDEVSIILKKRLDRQLNSILKQLNVSSLGEAFALICEKKLEDKRDISPGPTYESKLSALFTNQEKNILPYCIYNDVLVNAVINKDGKLFQSTNYANNSKIGLFFINGDDVYEHVITKSMRMSVFVKKAIDEGCTHFGLANGTSWCSTFEVGEYSTYEKDNFDKLMSQSELYSKKYLFVKEKSMFAQNDNEKIAVTLDSMLEFLNIRLHEQERKFLKQYDVKSFEELEELVKGARDSEVNFVDINRSELEEKFFMSLLEELRSKDYFSISAIQRKFSISFPKAKRVLENLIKMGMVDPNETKRGYKINKEMVNGYKPKN